MCRRGLIAGAAAYQRERLRLAAARRAAFLFPSRPMSRMHVRDRVNVPEGVMTIACPAKPLAER
jgi:hypothetical protein